MSVQQLFLKMMVCVGQNRLCVALECEKQDGRNQIATRFAHTGASFDYQMLFFLQRLRNGAAISCSSGRKLEILSFESGPSLWKEAAVRSTNSLPKCLSVGESCKLRTNEEARMSNDERMTKPEDERVSASDPLSLIIRHSSSVVIRISLIPLLL